MLGNFLYCNPAKLDLGDVALNFLISELAKYGPNVVLIYGGGSEMNAGSIITNPIRTRNLMWAATWALNTLVSRGRSTGWMVHMVSRNSLDA